LPLCDPQVWFFCVLWFGFGSIVFALPLPLHSVLCFMNFTRVSSLFPCFSLEEKNHLETIYSFKSLNC
jgi:hypothetical protein